MRVLLDNYVPRRLDPHLAAGHEVIHCQALGWDELSNGKLLTAAQAEFDVMLTTDSGIPYQQHLPKYDIGLIVVKARFNRTEDILHMLPNILEAIETIQPGQYVLVM